jgi:hypothetical protein
VLLRRVPRDALRLVRSCKEILLFLNFWNVRNRHPIEGVLSFVPFISKLAQFAVRNSSKAATERGLEVVLGGPIVIFTERQLD